MIEEQFFYKTLYYVSLLSNYSDVMSKLLNYFALIVIHSSFNHFDEIIDVLSFSAMNLHYIMNKNCQNPNTTTISVKRITESISIVQNNYKNVYRPIYLKIT